MTGRDSSRVNQMQDYPHIYKAAASAKPEGEVQVTSPNLADIVTTPPPEFGGPEGTWSPETLLVASVADCFNLTFRSIARASRFEWLELDCRAEGKLEKFNSITRFTVFYLKARLVVPEGTPTAKAERLLQMDHIDADWDKPPSADDVIQRDDDRLLVPLFQHHGHDRHHARSHCVRHDRPCPGGRNRSGRVR